MRPWTYNYISFSLGQGIGFGCFSPQWNKLCFLSTFSLAQGVQFLGLFWGSVGYEKLKFYRVLIGFFSDLPPPLPGTHPLPPPPTPSPPHTHTRRRMRLGLFITRALLDVFEMNAQLLKQLYKIYIVIVTYKQLTKGHLKELQHIDHLHLLLCYYQ